MKEVKKNILLRIFNKITKSQDVFIKKYDCNNPKFIAFIYYKFIDKNSLDIQIIKKLNV